MTQKVTFSTVKKKLEINDVSDFLIWDTARDNDGGVWRESFSFSGLPKEELESSFVRTELPATLLIIARSGSVEIHDATVVTNNRYQEPQSLIADIRADFDFVDSRIKVSAAEGVLAITDGSKVIYIDFVNNQMIELSQAGTYLLEHVEPFAPDWSMAERILIGNGLPILDEPITGIVASRANQLFAPRSGFYSTRPFIFISCSTVVIGIRPDFEIIQFSEPSWEHIERMDCSSKGDLVFSAGNAEFDFTGYVFSPSSWYYSLGTAQAASHASFVSPENATLSIGNDEFGITEVITGRMLVKDFDQGGSRVFHESGCGLKQPGTILYNICAIETPETNVVPYPLSDDTTMTGELLTEELNGFRFFFGWSGASHIDKTIDLEVESWNKSWSAAVILKKDSDLLAAQCVFEVASFPGNYTGSAARLVVEDNILKFEKTTDGWATIEAAVDLGELPTVPTVAMVGEIRSATQTKIFTNFNGVSKVETIASGPEYQNIGISVGVDRSGADSATAISISNLSLSFDFGSNDLGVFNENSELVKGQNRVGSLHGVVHYLAGGDDEFGVYSVLTDRAVVLFQRGVKSRLSLNLAGLLTETNIDKVRMRGWRIGIGYTYQFDSQDLFVSFGTLMFSRSDYEEILTGSKTPRDNTVKFSKLLLDDADFVGPFLPVSDEEAAIFEVTATALTENDNSLNHISGRILVNKRFGLSLSTVTSDFEVMQPSQNTQTIRLDAIAHAQGAYLFINPSNLNTSTEWTISVKRSHSI